MSCHLDLPLAYHARVVPKGRRSAVTKVFVSRVPAILASSTDRDAPLVARAAGLSFRRNADGFLTRATGPDVAQLSAGAFAALLANPDARRRWISYPLFSPEAGLPVFPFDDLPVLPEDDSVVWSEREVREGLARLEGSKLREIGGKVWHSIPEPFLAVSAGQRGVVGSIGISVSWRVSKLQDAACFGLDEVDRALSFASDLARAHRRPAPKAPAIEVCRPDLLSFDQGRLMADQIAARYSKEVREKVLPQNMRVGDAARREVEQLFKAVDTYGRDPAAVLAAAKHLMDRCSVCADLVRQAHFPVLSGQLSIWASTAGLVSEFSEQDALVLRGLAKS